MEMLHHPSQAPPTEYVMCAWGSEMGCMFHEGVWPPSGEGPSREDSPTHGFDSGGGGHSRNVNGNSQAPLLPLGVISSPTSPLLMLVNLSGPHTTTPTQLSPLKDAVVCAGGTSNRDDEPKEDNLMRKLRIGLRGLWCGRVGTLFFFCLLGFFSSLLPPPSLHFCFIVSICLLE